MSRSKKFSSEELIILLDELEARPYLVSGEFCREIPTKKHQKEAWDAIATRCNSCGMGICRTGTQLRGKWDDIKYRTRQKASKLLAHASSTGGGPPLLQKISAVEARVLQLVGTKNVKGIAGREFDSSALTKCVEKSQPNDAIPESQENTSQNFLEIMLIQENVKNDLPVEKTGNSAVNTVLSDIQEPENCQKENADGIDNENICPHPPQTPKMSWPIVPSTNNSTKRGQRYRLRKRKRMCEEMEDMEEKAIKTQSDMAADLKKISQSAENSLQTSTAILETLVNINNNIVNMSKKMDVIINLLSSSSSNV